MSTNTIKILLRDMDEVFEHWTISDFRESFELWRSAALSERYSWSRGTPGELLYFHDQVKTITRAGYELWSLQREKKKRVSNGTVLIQKYVKLIHDINCLEEVPSFLPPDKLMKPFESLESLFDKQNIEKISEQLHLMLDYGLSNASITDEENEEEYPVVWFDKFRKIIELVYSIYMLNKTKTLILESE